MQTRQIEKKLASASIVSGESKTTIKTDRKESTVAIISEPNYHFFSSGGHNSSKKWSMYRLNLHRIADWANL
jgi:hypothetical protein